MYGAVWIPDWPITAANLAGLIPVGMPVAIVGGKGIISVNAWARKYGVTEGMKKRAAHALCPDMLTLSPDSERDIRYFEPVVRALDEYIAHSTVIEPGSIVFPARSAILAAGSPERLAERIVGEIADVAGTESSVGCAESMVAALLAARQEVIVPQGGTPVYLGRQKLETLLLAANSRALREEMVHCIDVCSQLGIHTLSDFVALGCTPLTTRFGNIGTVMWELASGRDLQLSFADSSYEECHCIHSFEPAIDTMEQLAFAAKGMAADVVEVMSTQGAGGGRLTITATCENGESFSRSWMIEGRNEKDIVDRTRWQVNSWTVSSHERARIIRLELSMRDFVPLGFHPTPLWGGETTHATEAKKAALRIQGLVGEGSVRRIEHVGARDPREAYVMRAWGEDPSSLSQASLPWPGAIPAPLPGIIHTVDVPVDILGHCRHTMGVLADGILTCSQRCSGVMPQILAKHSLRMSLPHPNECRGEYVEDFAGPWIIEQTWWDNPIRRAYMQISTGEAAYLVYCQNGVWFEEGIYG